MSKRLGILFLSFLGAVAVLPSAAIVELRTGAYSEEFTDLEKDAIKFRRAYDSRCVERGVLGYGGRACWMCRFAGPVTEC